MPEWSPPPAETLKDALGETISALEHQVGSNPPMQEVVGISVESLMAHAAEAVATFIEKSSTKPADLDSLYQMYTLGFVVGVKFGEHRTMKE
jgi:hypothetical protein